MLNLPSSRAAFLEGVERAQYHFILWKFASGKYPDKPMPDNYGWKRDCDKHISVMMALPPALRSPSTADKMWLCLYGKYLSVSAMLIIYIVPICGVVEQKRTHVKIVSEQYVYDF